MKFSIRDLLLVTVIVALAVGWWVDRSRLNQEIRIVRGRKIYEKGMAEMQKMLVDGEEAGAKSKAALARDIEALDGQAGGPVRGYELLGPPLPTSQEPAPNPPKD